MFCLFQVQSEIRRLPSNGTGSAKQQGFNFPTFSAVTNLTQRNNNRTVKPTDRLFVAKWLRSYWHVWHAHHALLLQQTTTKLLTALLRNTSWFKLNATLISLELHQRKAELCWERESSTSACPYLCLHHEDAMHAHLVHDAEDVDVRVLGHVLQEPIHRDVSSRASNAGTSWEKYPIV